MRRILGWTPWIVIAIVVPFFAGDHLLFEVGVIATTAAIASGLTLVTGVAGQISIAQPAFVAIGSYGAVLLQIHFGIPLILGIPIATAAAGAVGWLLGFLCLRIEGHYLALVTLAFTGIAQQMLINLDVTGGAIGMTVPALAIGPVAIDTTMKIYVVAMVASLITLIAVDRLIDSRFGRVLAALRQSDIAATSLGVDRRAFRTLAVAASAVIGAFAGGFQAVQLTYLDPQQFGLLAAVHYIAIIVVGGMRSVHGAILGAILFVLFSGILSGLERYMALALYSLVIVSIVLMPGGIVSMAHLKLARWISPGPPRRARHA